MTPEQKQALTLREQGMSRSSIARAMSKTERQVKSLLLKARQWQEAPNALTNGATAVGADTPASVVWTKTHKDGSVTHSVMHSTDKKSDADFASDLISALQDYKPFIDAPAVNRGATGDHLLVVDLADVHFGKLSVASETGFHYSLDVARDRVVEGTRALLRKASGVGVGRVLFVMGNDVLNSDDGRATTSGTAQDSAGSYFQAYKAAQYASIDAITECATVAPVDLIHCMSNHDWRSGWALSQTIAAHARHIEGVRATDYNMSERHRKFYGFERNGLLLTHGDGTKEEKLHGHFMQEARHMLPHWDHLYALLHHVHHKKVSRRGVDVFQSEKDHIGITAVVSGQPRPEGVHVGIEYVRSPSPPDGWHDRNGYVNRQAVECFAYHPINGQDTRYTEWF